MVKLNRIFHFFKSDIWNIRIANLSDTRSFFLKQLRILLLAFHRLRKDQCSSKASALTYYSILSIIPILAIAFGIAKGFGVQNLLHQQILDNFPAQKEILTPVMEYAIQLLHKTQGETVAIIGVIFLLWIIISLIKNIENSFNQIWQVNKSRNIGKKFNDYITILLIGPAFVLISSMAVFISTQLRIFTVEDSIFFFINPLANGIMHLLPYALMWILFSFVIIFIPNIRVRFRSGLIAGIIAGSIYQATQWGYIEFQIGVAKYNAIYGSFAAIPLFIVWLQISWLILLFGVEISYAHQNVDAYEFARDCTNISPEYNRLLTLMVMHRIVKHYSDGEISRNIQELSNELEIPVRLVNSIISNLSTCCLIVAIVTDKNDTNWQPAQDINNYTIQYVIDSLDKWGVNDIHVKQSEELTQVSQSLKKMGILIMESDHNLLLKDL